ncbi:MULTISPECIES: TraR/DksA family transcriptional regulator [Modicisalibacter]|uniref:TraR/DksA C4-type zinc finger protein n=1 Tax=Modicisalibacter tunisiensis TaxID=390637 RepID=A0ABS7WYL3_9GAMM|nr:MULTISPECIES: TraR/DksA C4-type zinc finger protein [Modicisalibacter]MBZ9566961.1 TraR/DksA C4-type zinc finger protein [Modicisalibacter tunisiensis]
MNHPEIDPDTIREQLKRRRSEMVEQSEESKSSRTTVELDQTAVGRLSRMDALQGQAMAKAEEGRRQQTLLRIEAALERLDRGAFGECLVCGEWIAAKRLEWDPTVLKCIDCAE